MNQDEKFNNILSECLDRILKGETVEQCLLSYPEQAKELEPLLRIASAARVASTIQPRSEFKAKARYEFQAALREMANKESRRRPFFSWHWQWQSGWAIAIVSVLVVVLGGGSTVAAAGSSMPDNALYSVKLATEQVQLALTSSDIDKTELNAKFADRRANEIVYLASKGDVQQVQVTAERLNTNLENMTKLTGEETGNTAFTSTGTSESGSGPVSNGPEIASAPVAVSPDATLLSPASTLAPESPVPTEAPNAKAPKIASAPTIESTPDSETAPHDGAVGSETNNSTSTAGKSATRSFAQNTDGQKSTANKGLLSPRLEKMKKIIKANFDKRQASLEEAIKNAPPNVRPAIRQALARSLAEYNKAVQNLENTKQAAN
jgi:hypothetical protein